VKHRIAELLERDDVRAAASWIETHDARTLALQEEIVAIPAPTGAEGERAAFVEDRMRAAGLLDVRTDIAGNVLGRHGPGPGLGIVVCAHLDTVFPAGTDLEAVQSGPRLSAPGIGDNARGLTALLMLAEVLGTCGVRTPGPLTFVASVGEEGEGNLRGVRHLFEDPGFRPDGFIALDGPGLERIVHRALGSRRLRATFRGPGGHSWAAFGVPNPAHAVGAAAATISEIPLPAEPRTTLTVARLGGGSTINTIPQDAWLELDLRSESTTALEAAWSAVTAALQAALETTNRRRAPGTPPLVMDTTSLGDRPPGATDAQHPLVQAAVAATTALGAKPNLAAGSTDANVPMSLGVPAIALGAGGRGGDAHLTTEWFENVNGPAGILRALLVVLAARQVRVARG
jgi:acetylornithine deacetylase/succinyl-diaminopimelate desuccinylase-like protein